MAVGRTMSSKPPTSSKTREVRALRLVLAVRTDEEINISGDTPYTEAPKRGLSLYTLRPILARYLGLVHIDPVDRRGGRSVKEVERVAGGRDEALSAKDMLCPVRGVALAPVLEALWIYTDGEIENCFCLA